MIARRYGRLNVSPRAAVHDTQANCDQVMAPESTAGTGVAHTFASCERRGYTGKGCK
jgi:hypothetical protein